MAKTYKIIERREQGKVYNRITFSKDYKKIFDIQWLPHDREAEAKAIRSADLFVIKQGLNYEPRKLKPIKD